MMSWLLWFRPNAWLLKMAPVSAEWLQDIKRRTYRED